MHKKKQKTKASFSGLEHHPARKWISPTLQLQAMHKDKHNQPSKFIKK